MKLVISGSGLLYPLHVGALKRLVEEYEIEEICGTSGGAIIAAAYASGLTDIEDLVLNNMPSQGGLLDPAWIPTFNYGLIKGDKIESLLEEHFVSTFAETSIPIKVITVNLNDRTHTVWGTRETPNASVSKIVRASIGIPGLFSPVCIDGDWHVDGGVAANFPLNIYGTGEDVIGLRIRPERRDARRNISGLKDYLISIVETMFESMAREHINAAMYARTILLRADASGLNVMMERWEAKKLIDLGYAQADEWISQQGEK